MMDTLEITIQRKTGDTWPVIAEQSRPGSFLPLRSEGVLSLAPAELPPQLDPISYGTHLGQALFHKGIRDGFTRALADSQNNLRVLLFIEADDLRALRWERLCAPINNRWRELARNAQALYSLYLPSVTDSRFPAIGRRDLRALVIIANPTGLERYNLAPFDLPATLADVSAALGEIPFDLLASGVGSADQPTIKPVGPATLDALCERLTQEKYTLLHVVSHSLYSQRTGDAALLLANAQEHVGRVTASELIDRLRKLRGAHGLPHFTFLSICPNAPAQADSALAHLGQALVRDLGMPAVVAMPEPTAAAATRALTQTFYQQLRQHGEVDRALVAANAELTDVAPPILYSRLGGRPLFSDLLALDRPLTNAEITYGLTQLEQLLPARAPVLLGHFADRATQLRATLTTEAAALSPDLRTERETLLAELETINSEVLDFSFKALALGQEPPAYDDRCPYLGLAAFQAANRAFFFGREPLVSKLVNRLAAQNFLAVLGGSGSGKSSLVLAGLVPALQAQTPNLGVRYLTPTSNPVAQLHHALAEVVADAPQLIVVDQFEELFTLCTDEAQRQAFLDRLLALLNNPKSKIVLTMRADFWGECAAYPKLRELMQAHQELVGPMTAQELRSSMEQQARAVGLRFETDLSNTILDDVAGEPGAMPLLQHALLELWKRRHGRWLRADEYRSLGGVQQAIARTADTIYHELEDANRERMRAIFLRLTRLDEGKEAGETQRDTRRRVRLDELAADGDEAAVRNLVQHLANARLVMTTVRETTTPPPALPQPGGGTDPSAGPLPPPVPGEGWGGVEVEVTHEALIRHWPRLRGWLDEGRVALRLRQSLSNDATQWDLGARAESLLPRWNARLEETQRLAQNPRFGLNQLERLYLTACIALRDREAAEKAAQQQRELAQAQALAAEQHQRAEEQAKAAANLRQRAVFLAIAGAVAVLLAIAAGWFGVQAQRSEKVADERRQDAETAKADADIQRDKAKKNEAEAQEQAALARSRELGVHADNALAARNLDLALLLRIEGARTSETPEMINQLRALLTDYKRTLLRIPGHNSPVTQALWNAAQSQLLIAYADGRAGIWDRTSGAPLRSLTGHTAAIRAAAWSPDEQRLLTAGDDGVVFVWDAANGAQLLAIPADPEHVNAASWNAAGDRILTAGDDGTARIWDAATGAEVAVLAGHAAAVRLAHWNAAGDRILTAGVDGTARIWDAQSGEEIMALAGHQGVINSAAWNSTETRILTAGDDTTARVWDAETGAELLPLAGHDNSVTTAAWSPDDLQILTASLDGTARIWYAESGEEPLTLDQHTDAVRQARWSQDGIYVLTVSADKTAQVWDAATGDPLFALVGHTDKVIDAQWSPDMVEILTASDDGTVRVWDANEGAQPAGELPVLVSHSGRIGLMRWNARGDRLLTAGLDDDTARIVDQQNGEKLATLTGHSEGIRDAQWNQQADRVLTASDDGTARIWDTATGAELWQVQHAKRVFTARWSPDETRVLTASEDGVALLWDATTGKALRMLRGHGNGVLLAVWSQDGNQILTASMDDTARVWDAQSGQLRHKLDAHTGDVTHAFWNKAESRIYTASDDQTIKVWNAQTGALLLTLTGHTDVINTLRLNRDETRLLTTSEDGTTRVWDAQTGAELLTLTHDGPMEDARWNTTEDRILTASADGTARLWDAQTGREVATLPTYGQTISQVLWSQDDSQVLTASDDGRVRQFYVQPAAVIAAACLRGAIRNMTQSEWAHFMPDQSYRATCENLSAEKK